MSAASAYDSVGWDYRYETTLWATGDCAGTLQGDLLVAGSGDPSIASRGFPGVEDWVSALIDLGIQRIEGAVIGTTTPGGAAAGAGLAWDDLATRAAPVGALNTSENALSVTVARGPQAGAARS